MTQSAYKLLGQIVGNIGLYYASFRLSQIGWNVMPTARNARGIDVVAYDQQADRFLGIQIKTLSKRAPVPIGTSLDKVMGDFWIIVVGATDIPKSFVLRPEEVQSLAHRGEKDDRVSYWLQPKAYWTDEFMERWDRIGEP